MLQHGSIHVLILQEVQQKKRLKEAKKQTMQSQTLNYVNAHVVFMSTDFEIGPTERAVLASYTIVLPARLHYQCTGTNSQSELVIPNWL